MYVCICNAVTEKMIRVAAADGASSLDDLQRMTGCSTVCGSCADLAEDVLRRARRQVPAGLAFVAQAA
jgi:bacterioferritin-associated ferredoxin